MIGKRSNLALERVRLTSGSGCSNEAFELAYKIATELERKYPEILQPLVDEYAFSRTSLEAAALNPSSQHAVFSNGDVAVVFSTVFSRSDPPAYPYGGGALLRSLYEISRSSYDQQAGACGGTGYRRAQMSLTYLSVTSLQDMLGEIEKEVEAEHPNAADNL